MARARAVSPLALRSSTLTFCKRLKQNRCSDTKPWPKFLLCVITSPILKFCCAVALCLSSREQICGGKQLTWSSRFWTMISCPEAAASIRGVKPDPGSLWMKENAIKTSVWLERCTSFEISEYTHLTLASALLSSRNLTICWWPVLVQWNRAVQPRQSFSSNSAPCYRSKKNKHPSYKE